MLGCERKAAPPILIVILVLWSIDVVIVIVSGRSRWLVAPVSLIVVISTIVISGVLKVLPVPRLINMVIAVLSTAIATLPRSRRILEIRAALLIVSRIRVLLVVLLLFLDLVGDALGDILNSTLDDVSSDIATRSLVPEELRLNVKHARGQNVVGYDKAVKDKAESLLT